MRMAAIKRLDEIADAHKLMARLKGMTEMEILQDWKKDPSRYPEDFAGVAASLQEKMVTGGIKTFGIRTVYFDEEDLDFGTEEASTCGICRVPATGYWKNGELVEDIICEGCSAIYEFDGEQGGYVRKD